MGLAEEATASLALSTGLVVIGIALAAWLYYERRHREASLSPDDTVHFARQDFRRASVSLILGLLAIGIFAGSRVPPKVAGRANAVFVQIWLVVSVLVIALLVLAMIDWLATRDYARRHFRDLARERLDILTDELRHQARAERDGNGPAGNLGDTSGF